jgi:tetratricopeptide (TPR) repeat protein
MSRNFSVAEEIVRIGLQNDPHWPPFLTMSGKLTREFGRSTEGEAAFRQALELDPECYDTYLGLGMTCLDSKRMDEAIYYFEAAVQIVPYRPLVYFNLSKLKY